MSSKYLSLRGPSNPDLEDSQEYEPNMENLHIQKPTTFSLHMASQQSEVVRTGPYTHFTDGNAATKQGKQGYQAHEQQVTI